MTEIQDGRTGNAMSSLLLSRDCCGDKALKAPADGLSVSKDAAPEVQ